MTKLNMWQKQFDAEDDNDDCDDGDDSDCIQNHNVCDNDYDDEGGDDDENEDDGSGIRIIEV